MRYFPRSWLNVRMAAGCLCALLALPAAAQTEPDAVPQAVLTVAQSGGEATLQWQGEPGFVYTVLYAPERRSGVIWTPHPRFSRIPGTGEMIIVKDNFPLGTKRHYRLRVEPAAPARR